MNNQTKGDRMIEQAGKAMGVSNQCVPNSIVEYAAHPPKINCQRCNGSGWTGYEKPMGSVMGTLHMVFVPQRCSCTFEVA